MAECKIKLDTFKDSEICHDVFKMIDKCIMNFISNGIDVNITYNYNLGYISIMTYINKESEND